MMEDLLREFVAEPWVERLDFSTAERLNASYVSPRYSHREGDMVWRIETIDGTPVYLYILLEFQSSSDPYMPLRGMTYKCLFYQDLIAGKRLTPSGKLPPVIVIFLYNGEEPWRGPLELSDLIERIDPSAEIYIPRLRCRLIDESLYDHEVLDRSLSPVASLFRLERSRSTPATDPPHIPKGRRSGRGYPGRATPPISCSSRSKPISVPQSEGAVKDA